MTHNSKQVTLIENDFLLRGEPNKKGLISYVLYICAGIHLIEVLYDDVPVPKSPFRVSVVEGCDPSRVRAFGPGLEGGITNKPNCFTVETR